jgi:hypothetical protein
MEMSVDSMIVTDQSGPRWLAVAEIVYMERSTRRYRRFARNFAMTTGGTAAAGGMLAALAWKEGGSRSGAFLAGAMIGAVLSAPAGVILGMAIRYDRWEPAVISGSRRSGVSVTPLPGRSLGASASISF